MRTTETPRGFAARIVGNVSLLLIVVGFIALPFDGVPDGEIDFAHWPLLGGLLGAFVSSLLIDPPGSNH